MKSKKIKIAGGIAATVVVLCAVIAVIFKFTGGKEDYRNISVFELNASATVTRDGTALDAYPGMKLMNGDDIRVGNEGYICLLLDDDKYVTLETGTEIRLNATGNSKNSKTTIELVQGAVLNELDSKLNADSSYELSTPVSVMAVRGTVFRAALNTDGEASSMDLIVLDGQVAAADVLADGTVSSKENLVDAGKGAHVEKPDAQSDPVFSSTDISYDDLPAQTLAMILKIYESGRIPNLSISKDELEKLYEKKTSSETEPAEDNTSDNAPSNPDGTSSDTQEEMDSDNTGDETDDNSQSDPDENGDGNSGTDSDTTPNTNSVSSSNSASKPTAKPNTANNTKPAAKKHEKTSAKPTKKPSTGKKEEPTAKPGVVSPTNPPANPPAVQPPNTENENKVYTVTFKDSFGGTFGTQSITSGSRAQKPKLSPAGGTNWYDSQGNIFDFNTVITGDITLYYR